MSDRIARFCIPIEHVDREGLMTLLLLSLPGSPHTLLISLYCPPHDTRLRQIISEALDVLLPKYPSHIIGGDFNTSINLSLDTDNIISSNAWPWLSNKVNKQPQALHETFRGKRPHLKRFSRYWSTNHQNQARLDYIFASPQFTSTHPILDADIETSNFFSDHQPAFITCSAPVIPSFATQSPPAPVFRRLSQDETHQFEHFLSPLNKWLKAIQPSIEHLSQDEVVFANHIHHFRDLHGLPPHHQNSCAPHHERGKEIQ